MWAIREQFYFTAVLTVIQRTTMWECYAWCGTKPGSGRHLLCCCWKSQAEIIVKLIPTLPWLNRLGKKVNETQGQDWTLSALWPSVIEAILCSWSSWYWSQSSMDGSNTEKQHRPKLFPKAITENTCCRKHKRFTINIMRIFWFDSRGRPGT